MQQMMNFYIPSLYHIYPCKQVAMQQNIMQTNKMTFCHTAMLKFGITMSIQVMNLPQLMRQFTFMSFLWFVSAISQHIKVTHTHTASTDTCLFPLQKCIIISYSSLVHSPDLNKHNYLHALQLNSKAIIDIHDNGSNATVIIACTELVLHYDIIKSLCVL